MLRFLTSGESHGATLVAVLDGMPAGLNIDLDRINQELQLRQQGYGRGNRQKIETDTAEFVGGVRHGITSGAPLSILVRNRDFENWRHVMSVSSIDLNDKQVKEELSKREITRFRPGHADLPGTLKFRQRDIRDVLERASARETAARVAVGAVCIQLLERLGIKMMSHVIAVGNVQLDVDVDQWDLDRLAAEAGKSEMLCSHAATSDRMIDVVKTAWQDGDSLGGIVEVLCDGLPVGLGSYTQWDEKLDGQLAQALMSIQAMKAVEVGQGVSSARLPGSQVHDALYPSDVQDDLPFRRKTNRAGGIEGGMTNGSRLKVRAYMKPIPTLRKGLPSLSFPEFDAQTAHYERSDVCAVPAASVVAKAMVAFVLARALLNKFGGDTLHDIESALQCYREYCRGMKQEAEDLSGSMLTADTVPDMELE